MLTILSIFGSLRLKKKNVLYGKQRVWHWNWKLKWTLGSFGNDISPHYSWPEGLSEKLAAKESIQYSVSTSFSTLTGCKVNSRSYDSVLLQEQIRETHFLAVPFWLEAGCSWTGSRVNHNVLSCGNDSIWILDLITKSNQLANKQTIVCVLDSLTCI